MNVRDLLKIYDIQEQNQAGEISFRDFLSIVLLGFISIVFILIFLINPPKKKDAEEESKIPGSIMVEIAWKNGVDVDIDLWIQPPEGPPLGYTNKTTEFADLVRDDLGTRNDLLDLNYENAYSRYLIPGEWIINAHYFRDGANYGPIKVTMLLTIKNKDGIVVYRMKTTKTLNYQGEEVTLVRFELDENGNLIPSSIDDTFVPIRCVTKESCQARTF